MNLSSLIYYYIPTNQILEKKKVMFDILLGLLAKPEIDENTKVPIVDSLFAFLSDIEHLKLAQTWLQEGSIRATVGGPDLYSLSKRNKNSILVKLFEEPSISIELKSQLLEQTLGDDKSDLAQNTRDTCFAITADPANKAQVWAQITDVNSKESIYTRSAKMSGFYSVKQVDLVMPYWDKFFEVLPNIYEKQTFKYVEAFFNNMLPRVDIRDDHIVNLLALKLQTPDNNTNFANLINEGIELLMRSKAVREYAQLGSKL